ncbi:unnamed protein product [Toxocara canis]|uniref:UBIQUITIN_CONJUGAT_2 domain-containing protein n=1 Tax=Toxocara canis TaxID=6265 RepID=A0A183VH99_TOXCA|nr:unnamed protein product [Toxocara canis]
MSSLAGTVKCFLYAWFYIADLKKDPVEGFSAGLRGEGDDIYKWEVLILGPPDTPYNAVDMDCRAVASLKASTITKFDASHVDKNGNVCISILHAPGDDQWGYEKPEERWLPVHTVETILLSVISMLADPNRESPANVDAAREMKEKKMTNAPAQGLYKTTDVDHKALGDQSAYGKAFFSLANVLIEVRNSVDVSFNAPTCTLLTCG